MASAGSITWDLIANSSKFVSELEKANKAGKNWGDKMAKSAKGVATIFAKAGLAAAASLAALYTMTASNIDAQAKFADKIGVTTTALGGLHHVADLTGVSTQDMNLGLQRMTRRVAEAAQGTGAAVNALKRLNLSAEELNKLKPDEQFLAIADAIGQVEGRSEKVRLAFKLFDSGGVALLNTMDMTSAGIRDAMEQAEKLGIALNRIDAAKVENANDAFDNMKKVSSGISRQITVAFAPAVEAVSTKMVQLALDTEGFGNIGIVVFDAVAKAIGLVADASHIVILTLAATRAAMFELAAVAAESMTSCANIVATVLNATVGNLGKLIQWLSEKLSALVALGKKLPGHVGQWAGEASEILTDLGKKVNASMQFDATEVVAGIGKIRQAANDAYVDFDAMANMQLPSDQIQQIVQSWKDVSHASAEAAANSKNYNDVVESNGTAVTKMSGLVKANVADMNNAFKNWGDNFTNTMADIVNTGTLDFRKLAESIINDLVRMAIQANITNNILRGLGWNNSGGGTGGDTPSPGPNSMSSASRGSAGLMGRPTANSAQGAAPQVANQTTVNVYPQPGETAETKTRSTPEGDVIDVFIRKVDSHINDQISRGQGLARTLEGRYALSRRNY